MRVTNAATYRNFTTSVNNVHLALNKSMNKISTGAAYETAAESPLSYYEGNKIDSQYQDTLSKSSLIKDIRNRIYQQEVGARTIQDVLSKPNGAKNQVRFARTDTTSETALQTTMEDLQQKSQEIVDALNTEYEDYFVYGGNDYKVPPFSLDIDMENNQSTLTFTHTFPGDSTASKVVLIMKDNGDGSHGFEIDNASSTSPDANLNGNGAAILRKAMAEQGRVDVGYGTISQRDTLIDTFTGGINILTGITSDSVDLTALSPSENTILEKLTDSSLGLVLQSIHVIDDYIHPQGGGEADRGVMSDQLGDILTKMTTAEQGLGSIYSDLGNKYNLLETTEARLNNTADALTTQYKDKLGADPYESIMEMYNNNYAYNAALKVGSQLLSSSLFDFVR